MNNTSDAIGRQRVIVYIDESGDRNSKDNRQSDFFTMTAVLVEAEHEHQLRMQIEGAKAIWKVSSNQLHWVKHLKRKQSDRRRTLCEMLAVVPSVKVIHVILDKANLRKTSHLAMRQEAAYNYTARFLLERVAHAAEGWTGGARIAQVYFGIVGGVDIKGVDKYLNHCASHEQGEVPWNAVKWPLKFEATSKLSGLQAADMYSGMLWVALNHDDRQWLDLVHHQLYRSPAGEVEGYGIKTHPGVAAGGVAHLCELR